jgi:hypothetical protein
MDCPAGYTSYAPASTMCFACAPGQQAFAGGWCVNCLAGKYSSAEASLQCELCPAGKAISYAAATQCDMCSSGTYTSLQGQTSCQSCTVCLGNTFPAENYQYIPSPFVASSYQVAGCNHTQNTICQSCKTCNSTSFVTFICDGMEDTECKTCQSCTRGQFIQANTCASNKDSVCTLCLPGSFMDDLTHWRRECMPCPPGYYALEAGSSSCTPAQPGFHVPAPGMNRQLPCPAGSYSEKNGTIHCSLCEPGTASLQVAASNASVCQPCNESFTYSDKPGSTTCKNCSRCTGWSFTRQAGSFLVSNCSVSQDTLCKPCENCTQNGTRYFLGYCSLTRDSVCAACSPCPSGQYVQRQCQATFNTSCRLCDFGSHQPFAGFNTSCLLCKPGTYAISQGQSFCADAVPGQSVPGPIFVLVLPMLSFNI